jgi:hypothetical protein
MALRSLLFAVGLGTLWGGCKTSLGRLPDSAAAAAAFSPNEPRILVLPPHRMYTWDLEARRIVRDRSIAQAQAGIAFSPSGTFVVLAAQELDDRRVAVSLLRTRDGETVLARELRDGGVVTDYWYTKRTEQILAATDDGRWLASYDLGTGELEIVAVADGSTALRAPLAGYFQRIAFDARGDRLFASTEAADQHTVLIVALSGGKWAPAATLDGALHPAWTAKGLSFMTARGLEMWDGGAARLVFPKDPELNLQPDGPEPPWRFSPDGAFCLLWSDHRFVVRETASGAIIAARDVDAAGTPAVWAAAFVPGRVRALLATGEFVEVELAARSIARRASFGRPGHYAKNWFQDGSSWQTRYTALLSPTGRYLAIFKRDIGYEIFLME